MKLVPQPLEAAADRGIEEPVSDLDRQSADEVGIDLRAELDGRAGHRLDPAPDRGGLVRGERHGTGDRGLHHTAVGVEQAVVVLADRGQAVDLAALDEEADEPQGLR